MPLYQLQNLSKFVKIGVWKITESENTLLDTLIKRGVNIADSDKIKSSQHLKQWLAARLLLIEFFEDVKIIYDSLGKPFLDNGWSISISHSHDFATIIVNKESNCGIDIERIDEKVDRIKHKFLNSSDLKTVRSLKDLTIYWSAKEALYKFYGKKGTLFKENLFVSNFNSKKSDFIGSIKREDYSKEISMNYEIIEDYVLVYTL